MTELILLGLIAIFLTFFVVFTTYAVILLFYYKAPLIPTDKRIAKKMVELAKVKPKNRVYDLGCGFGSILFCAYKVEPKAQYIGYEILKPVVWLNRKRAQFFKQPVTFNDTDFFNSDISDADVIFLYLWDSLMERFYEEKYSSLKSGTRIISHGFQIRDLEPLKIEKVGRAKIYFYQK